MKSIMASRNKKTVALLALFAACVCSLVQVVYAASMPEYERLQPITANLDAPIAVAVDAHDNIYVAESINNHLRVYDQDGGYLNTLSGLDRPISVAVDDDGRIFVGNAGRSNVEVYGASFNFLHKLGSGDGEFVKPGGIAVDSAGNAYVADSKADQVKVYNPDGAYSFSFGTSGSADGQFNFPVSISTNEQSGQIVVSDLPLVDSWTGMYQGARIQIFDLNGDFLRSFGEFGQGEGQLTKPLGVTVDGDGRIYVSDAYQNVVQVFDGDGTYLGAVYDLDNPMRTPLGIAFGKATGRLLIASLNTSRVEVYALAATPAGLQCRMGMPELQAVANLWRQPAEPPNYDSDGDGIITVVDIVQVAALWGEPCYQDRGGETRWHHK